MVVALNAGNETVTLPALGDTAYLAEGSILLTLMDTANQDRHVYRVLPGGQLENFKVPPRTGMILEVVRLAKD